MEWPGYWNQSAWGTFAGASGVGLSLVAIFVAARVSRRLTTSRLLGALGRLELAATDVQYMVTAGRHALDLALRHWQAASAEVRGLAGHRRRGVDLTSLTTLLSQIPPMISDSRRLMDLNFSTEDATHLLRAALDDGVDLARVARTELEQRGGSR